MLLHHTKIAHRGPGASSAQIIINGAVLPHVSVPAANTANEGDANVLNTCVGDTAIWALFSPQSPPKREWHFPADALLSTRERPRSNEQWPTSSFHWRLILDNRDTDLTGLPHRSASNHLAGWHVTVTVTGRIEKSREWHDVATILALWLNSTVGVDDPESWQRDYRVWTRKKLQTTSNTGGDGFVGTTREI
ncbi:hypothetical protein GLAREA_12434 [Glarea lozoyensis ATCC 20868]|uniref:Uncharacterized protein n=1 Tax=Glarea lozoyensis (strain ATCC 20868 / MF5171) TaxID=1116229 RepID=S3DZC8_GLAL2|nr:uncharacterized protein GLAREA_12434 [Glarea lozoyensis ATCC 20868]EPE31678.1 hypothetical protein GLAREA_12434 [Glarea lozoyensis ATCC 20868]